MKLLQNYILHVITVCCSELNSQTLVKCRLLNSSFLFYYVSTDVGTSLKYLLIVKVGKSMVCFDERTGNRSFECRTFLGKIKESTRI